MTLTNKHNIPEVFVNAVQRHIHIGADYSASQMTKSGRMVMLEKRHKDEIVEDVLDRIWALFGTAVHSVLEGGEESQALVETYFDTTLPSGVRVSGITDHYKNKRISDYKITSVWSYVFLADKMDDFESQLNICKWLFEKNDFEVNELNIVMIFRDWSKNQVKDGYPDKQIMEIPVKAWTHETTQQYIENRVDYYESLREIPDNDLPFCTLKERWAKPPRYAVMKQGAKRAKRVLDTPEQAQDYIVREMLDGKHYIEERKGEEYKRCEYCSVSEFCNQYKNFINKGY